VPSWLVAAARRAPHRPALVVGGESLSYSEMLDAADRAAGSLAERGARPGTVVGLALTPGAAFVIALHACWRLGCVPAPLDARLTDTERAVQAVTADVMVGEPLGVEPTAPVALRDNHDPQETALLVHTSGTTGAPRPVALSFGNWHASVAASDERLGADPEERWLCTMPLSHVGGLSILVRAAVNATTVVLHERFDAERVAAALSGGEATAVSLVPTMLGRLLDAGVRPHPALRLALVGGGPLTGGLARRALDAGFPLARTYGLTEACSQVATTEIGAVEEAAAPLAGVRVRIAPDGEILVAGPTVARGATAPDGFLHTGDAGRLDDRGRLTVSGRLSDTIVTGGENVAPTEVEAVLLAHPAVAEVAVHGRVHLEWGEAVIATVVIAPGAHASEAELRAHCASALAGYKVPKAFEFTAALPRTASGKVLRAAL